MNKLSMGLLISLLSIAISGCKETIEIIDGLVPAAYLSSAQPLLGEYTGSMDHRSMSMIISFDGNRATLLPNEAVIQGCDARIGDLIQLTVSKQGEGYEISKAVFSLYPATCGNITATTAVVELFKKDDKINMQVDIEETIADTSICVVNRPYGYTSTGVGVGGGIGSYGGGFGYGTGIGFSIPLGSLFSSSDSCSSSAKTVHLVGTFVKVDN